ncbi:MAG: alpha/beta hydrolase [Mycobacteriaceae bacterium]|nr:alpha/beta hydrolase [Mycobacteriaceae bacterium]
MLVSGDAAAAARPRVCHVYQRVGRAELRLDVKLPHGDSPGLRPAVVWVHGGGWVAGNRAEGGMWHRWLNDRGYAVFAVDYRLAPPPRWNQAPGDVLCAIGWVKQHAAQYHVDPNRMVIAGGSAGGNLALMAAYADARVRPSCPVADSSVRAVMALYPGSDLVTLWHDTGPHAIRVAVQKYTGGTPWQYPERYAAASPITYVRRGIPPTLLLHGTRDHISPFVLATELDDKLAAAGVEHELLAVPYGEHVFDLAWGDWGTQISRRVFARFLDRYCPAES